MLINKNRGKNRKQNTIDEITWDSSRKLVQKVGRRLGELNKPISGYTLFNLIEEQYYRHKFYQLYDVQRQFMQENEFSSNTIGSMDEATFVSAFVHNSKALNKHQEANLKLLYAESELKFSEIEPQKQSDWSEIPVFGKPFVSEMIPTDNGDFEFIPEHSIETPYSVLEIYNDDGVKVLEEGFHENFKHGPTILYYPNGAKEYEELNYYGERNGSSTSWHPNGVIESEGFCFEGRSVGVWTYYDEGGHVVGKIHGEDVLQRDLKTQGKKVFIKQYELVDAT